MTKQFIEVGTRILDYEGYKNDVAALRYELVYELNEVLSRYGFRLTDKQIKDFHCLKVSFRQDILELSMEISMRHSKDGLNRRN